METPKIFDSELRFCEILWEHQPVKSSELVRLCAEKLGWKKSTTYTVIKRLTERGDAFDGPHAAAVAGRGNRAANALGGLMPRSASGLPA